jgi:[ribosomal protein S5]-alanine N-acetyltransferase
MILQTQHLILREFAEEDLDVLAHLLANEEVMRFSLSGPLGSDRVKEFLRKRILDHYVKYGFGLYAVFNQKDDQFIGFVGLIAQNSVLDKK